MECGVKPIDFDTSGKRFIQNVTVQPRTVSTKNTDGLVSSQKDATSQIAELFHLVQSATEKMGSNERTTQIMSEINRDTYTIDFDALADHIANDLFAV